MRAVTRAERWSYFALGLGLGALVGVGATLWLLGVWG